VPPGQPEGLPPFTDEPELLEPGLWRIPVPLPFALRSANIYLIDDGDGGWTLIDSGLGLPADEAALYDGLARAGVAPERLTALILTHAHPDHIGLSGPIQAASGAPVYMLAGEDERLYQVWRADEGAAFEAVSVMYATNGMPPDIAEQTARISRRISSMLRLPPRESVRALQDGETLRIGVHSYQAIWTPGHSDYHLCLLREDGLFIAGDHILPRITPNIGLYVLARPNPLRDYFDALARVRDLPARLTLPGHGRPFTALAERVDELRVHHEERSQMVLDLLAERPGGAHASDLADALFEGRLRNADDRRFALAETLAHLEYLRYEGRVDRATGLDGVIRYAVITARALAD
jgi:glyoxylase-like metal-dependent hydrolase (beta-lactamase superfamily II)